MSKTIYLDLDNTLLCSYSPTMPTDIKQNISIDNIYSLDFGRDDKYEGVYRPHLYKFLNFCREYFDKVIIYTAGSDDYGKLIAANLEKFSGIQFDDIFTRDHNLLMDIDWKTEENYRKPLTLLIDPKGKIKEKDYLKHVLLVDDKFSNFRFNARNGIHIPVFDPQTYQEYTEDSDLLILMNWLNMDSIKYSPDYRTINKDLIFGKYLDVDFF